MLFLLTALLSKPRLCYLSRLPLMACFPLAWPLLGKLEWGLEALTSTFNLILLYMLALLLKRGYFRKLLKIKVLDWMIFAHVYIFSSENTDSLYLANSLLCFVTLRFNQ